jgi:hypothetical protein
MICPMQRSEAAKAARTFPVRIDFPADESPFLTAAERYEALTTAPHIGAFLVVLETFKEKGTEGSDASSHLTDPVHAVTSAISSSPKGSCFSRSDFGGTTRMGFSLVDAPFPRAKYSPF